MQPYSLPLERGQWIARRAIIRPAIVLLIFLAAGCIHDSEVVYHPDARVLLENGELAVASGAQTVLEVNRFKGRVLSDVATEYTFYLEIDTALIRSGTRLAIPSEGVRPHLWFLAAPKEHVTENCSGWLEILDVGSRRLIANVEAHSEDPGFDWKLKERFIFTLALPSPSHPEPSAHHGSCGVSGHVGG